MSDADLSWFTTLLEWQLWRYAVSYTHNELTDTDELQHNLVRQYKLWVEAMDLQNLIVGWWMNDDGKYYIDMGTTVDDLWIAKALGQLRGQLAIFDLHTMKEIRLA